jgi:hypothetical protein
MYTACAHNNSYSTTPLRAQRRAELVAVLESGTERLFHQQIKMLTSSALRSYKRDLLALLNSDKLSEEEEATLLRKVSTATATVYTASISVCVCSWW